MAPTLTDYLHGLRRLWWVPLITLTLGIGASFLVRDASAPPTSVTTGHVLFTFRVEEPGDDSAGTARSAEAAVGDLRLNAYVRLVAASQQVRSLLSAQGIQRPPTALSLTGGTTAAGAPVTMAPTGGGVVEVQLRNGTLSKPEASQLVEDLSHEMARSALVMDALQPSLSLLPDPVVTTPQTVDDAPSPRGMRRFVPILLLFTVGLVVVYGVVWRQGRINSRGDVEVRLGARVLGDVAGRPSDGAALALALIKGREGGTRALLTTVGGPSEAAAKLGDLIVNAGSDLGLRITLAATSEAILQSPAAVTSGPGDRSPSATEDLAVAVTANGFDADALRIAASVDIVGLVVQYRTTSSRELVSLARTLSEVTDAEIAVIGVRP